MTDELRDELAEILASHIYIWNGYECACGADGLDRVDHKLHVADALLPIVERHVAQARAETAEEIAADMERLKIVAVSSMGANPDYTTPEGMAVASVEEWLDESTRIARQHAQAPTRGDAQGWVDRSRPVAADRRAPAAPKQVPVSPPTEGKTPGAEPRPGTGDHPDSWRFDGDLGAEQDSETGASGE